MDLVPAVAKDKIVLMLSDITSNIWMARRPER
jgi:hypothetical protein